MDKGALDVSVLVKSAIVISFQFRSGPWGEIGP